MTRSNKRTMTVNEYDVDVRKKNVDFNWVIVGDDNHWYATLPSDATYEEALKEAKFAMLNGNEGEYPFKVYVYKAYEVANVDIEFDYDK